ncbi:MAG: ABC transporter substrate-binding protein [Myxococcales bacterium]|nr:ABC transporter substrate-binding protein [Myxococcales bacterium]
MVTRMFALFFLCALVGAAPRVAVGNEAISPKGTIDARYQDIEKIISSSVSEDAMREQIRELMETFVDYTELSRLTIKEHWDGLGAEKQKEFVGLFKQLIRRSYSRRFKSDVTLTVKYDGEAVIKSGKAQLKTTVTSGNTTVDVEYRMHQPAGTEGWWVYDLVIDEVSMVRNYRKQFADIIAKDGIEKLFVNLRSRAEKGEE